jgi:transposase-like protein
MLAAALEAEVAAYVAAHATELDERGHRLVVRNGHAVPRQVLTSAGAVEVRAPRVNDSASRRAPVSGARFTSAILPAWCRRSPKITEVLPLLYLHGLSSKDFVPALEGFLGTDMGLSAATITRLTVQWQDDARAFGERDLSNVDYVYMWADGIVGSSVRVRCGSCERPASRSRRLPGIWGSTTAPLRCRFRRRGEPLIGRRVRSPGRVG